MKEIEGKEDVEIDPRLTIVVERMLDRCGTGGHCDDLPGRCTHAAEAAGAVGRSEHELPAYACMHACTHAWRSGPREGSIPRQSTAARAHTLPQVR